MTAYLCRSRACNMPGIHRDDADPEDCPPGPNPPACRGCGPAEAADGLQLCNVCARRLGHDAWRIAWFHDALGRAIAGNSRAQGDHAGGTNRAPGLDLRDPVVEARDTIRNLLVGLVRLIAEERGIAPPWRHELAVEQLPAGFVGPPRARRRIRGDNTARAFAAYIDRHAVWLAAHPVAAEHAEQLRDTALDPRTWRLAFPTHSNRVPLGLCPLDTGTGACGTRLYALDPAAEVTCRGCGTTAPIAHWLRWQGETTTGIVDGYQAAAALSLTWGVVVEQRVLRVWACRGKLTRQGRDERGRTLYDMDEVREVAQATWGTKQEAAA